MNEKLLIILILCALLIIGFIKLIVKKNNLIAESIFAREYLSKFQQFISSYPKDFNSELYSWLNHRLLKINSQLGILGTIDYKPPASNYYIKGYQIIPNTLSLMRSRYSSLGRPIQEIQWCEDILIRYIGLTDDWQTSYNKKLRNPFIWLREGVQIILSLPVLLLGWVGLTSDSATKSLTENTVFRFLTGLITLIGLVASIITISLGWEKFFELFS